MTKRRPSFTAEIDAVIRCVETEKPADKRLCYDPLARGFIGPGLTLLGLLAPIKKLALWYLDRRHPCLFDCIVARTRYVDEYVMACIDEGVQQLVNLGAGYDSRAYRIKGLKDGNVKVFEVDLPATQKLKKERVRRMLGSLPRNVVYVSIDFNSEKLSEKLLHCGYDKDLKSLFIWEGVTPVLTAEAVDETLHFIAGNSGAGSSIIFNYILKSVVDGTCQHEHAKVIKEAFNRGGILDFHASKGEGLKFGIEEGTIEEFLLERGFYQIKDISGDYYQETYFKGPNSARKVCCLCRVAYAKVKHQ